jgi:polyvinyl alcohol dehydrogenase (cytochrome)
MWFSSLFAPRTRRGRRKSASCRLRLEALEDRLVPSAVDVVPGDPKDWPMYNHDPSGSRYNSAETRLRPDNVSGLQVLWNFPTAGPIAGTPAVVDDQVYVADATGVVYALDRDGHELWQTTLQVGPTFSHVKVSASVLVTNHTVIIGDLSGQIHGLDVDTGAEKWTIRPNPHPFASIWGSATMVGHDVAIGVASVEEFVAPFIPNYAPSFRGSLVLLDPATGHVIWQTYTISAAENAAGAAGAAIWSTPTYAQGLNTIYVTTGNNYSEPTTATSDAFIAVDAKTGAIKWVNQRTRDDTWTFVYGESSAAHPDFDIGDSPQIYKIGGETVVSAGQKSGFFHVLDAATGAEVSPPIQMAPSGTVGGLFADSAYANGVNFANGTDWPGLLSGKPPNRGILSAISADGSHELWHFDTPGSPNISGVAVANGVVYFQSMLDGTFYALDATTGQLLASVVTGGESSGPAISRGQIYLGTGDAAFPFLNPSLSLGPGSIVALGIDDPGRSSSQGAQSPAPAAGGSASLPAASRPFQGSGSGSFVNAEGGFLAQGIATHLGFFTHSGTLLLTPTDNPSVFSISGRTVYIAANGDRLYAIISGTLNVQTGVGSGTDTWDGGTGRFADATGSVAISAQLSPDGSFVFTLVGNISY